MERVAPISSDKATELLALAKRLRDRYKDLQKAKATLGHLESNLKIRNDYIAALWQAEEQRQQLAELERQNEEMERNLRKAQLADVLSKQNQEIRRHIQSVANDHIPGERVIPVRRSPSGQLQSKQSPKAFKMEDYYRMIQQHLESRIDLR